jgi:hypothetical protein
MSAFSTISTSEPEYTITLGKYQCFYDRFYSCNDPRAENRISTKMNGLCGEKLTHTKCVVYTFVMLHIFKNTYYENEEWIKHDQNLRLAPGRVLPHISEVITEQLMIQMIKDIFGENVDWKPKNEEVIQKHKEIEARYYELKSVLVQMEHIKSWSDFNEIAPFDDDFKQSIKVMLVRGDQALIDRNLAYDKWLEAQKAHMRRGQERRDEGVMCDILSVAQSIDQKFIDDNLSPIKCGDESGKKVFKILSADALALKMKHWDLNNVSNLMGYFIRVLTSLGIGKVITVEEFVLCYCEAVKLQDKRIGGIQSRYMFSGNLMGLELAANKLLSEDDAKLARSVYTSFSLTDMASKNAEVKNLLIQISGE